MKQYFFVSTFFRIFVRKVEHMTKKIIRLTESELKEVVKNAAKQVIEQSINTHTINDELWEYIRLPRKRTNLKYDIFVDNNEAYKSYGHPLWLYVDCGGIKIPITIEEHPQIMTFIEKNEFDFSDVYEFIVKNLPLLGKLANRQIEDSIFFRLLKGVTEAKTTKKDSIVEMATLHQSESKLPTLLWLDDDKLYEPHAPRIKFRADFQNKNTRNDPSMEIENTDRIHNMPHNNNLSNSDIKHISLFVKANQNALLSLANREMDFEEFKQQMKIVDNNGNIVNTNNVSIGNFVNGFAICEKDGKFNYIDENGDYMFKDFILDKATNFNQYGNGLLIAYVIADGREFYIGPNGKEIKL